MKILIRILIVILLAGVIAFSQDIEETDIVNLKSADILFGRIESFYNNTLVIETADKDVAVGKVALTRVWLAGMGTVFENGNYIYSIDSLNHFLFRRDNKNPDIVFKNGKQIPVQGNHEFSLSVGLFTSAQFVDIFQSIFSAIASGDDLKKESNGSVHLLLGYRYITNKNLVYGAHLNYERYKYDLYTNNSKIGFTELNYFSIAFNISYYWLKFDWFHLYSGLGAGIRYINFDTDGNTEVTFKNHLGPALHLNILGLKAGKKLFFLFETGAGYRGIFTIGLAYKL